MTPILVGCFWPTAILIVLLRSSGYSITSTEALLALGLAGLIGLSLGFILKVLRRSIRIAIYAGLLALMCNALYRPYPELPFVGASADWALPMLIVFGSYLVLVFFGKDADGLVATVFGAFFIGAFFTTQLNDAGWASETELFAPVDQASLPPYVHIVLDGHIGFEQIPKGYSAAKASKSKYLEMYVERGFNLYGNAYVNHTYTTLSFSDFLSYGEAIKFDEATTNTKEARNNLLLNPNRLFDSLRDSGYKISVVRSSHLDLCSDNDGANIVDKCNVYPYSPLVDSIIGSDLPIRNKAFLMVNNIFQRSGIVAMLNRIASTKIGQELGFPVWPFQSCLHCISAKTALDTVTQSLPELRPGHALFIHLIHPHGPFQAYDKNCIPKILPTFSPGTPVANFDLYMGQLECSQRMIASFLDRLMATDVGQNSIVVIHGDHGVRNTELNVPWQSRNLDDFNVSFANLGKAVHSTFFAVKSPKVQGNYSKRLISLNDALRSVVTHLPVRGR